MSSPGDITRAEHLRNLGRVALAAQPFSELLGTELCDLQPGRAELHLAVSPFLLQQSGFVHGGVLAYLADSAVTFAAGSLLDGGLVTADLKLNYLRPARGKQLIATATVVHAGPMLVVCRCEIAMVSAAGERTACALAQGTAARHTPQPEAAAAGLDLTIG
jgi:uncharacterized protein (TIGR00369 family)